MIGESIFDEGFQEARRRWKLDVEVVGCHVDLTAAMVVNGIPEPQALDRTVNPDR